MTRLGYGLLASLCACSLAFAVQRAWFNGSPPEDPPDAVVNAAAARPPRAAPAEDRGEGPSVAETWARRPRPVASVAAARADGSDAAPADEPAGATTDGWTPFTAFRWLWPPRAEDPAPARPPAVAAGARSVNSGAPAAASSPAAASTRGSGSSPATAVYFSTSPDIVCQPGAYQFLLDDVRDLYVCVVWAGTVSGDAELAFVSPDGHIYQRLTLPAQPKTTAALPVAGTFITQHTLAGQWTLRLALNGVTAGEHPFELITQ